MPTTTHTVEDVIREMLIDLGLGTDPDDSDSWPIGIGSLPDTPDEVINIGHTSGINDGRDMPTGERAFHPGIKVMVRSRKRTTGRLKAEAIAVAFSESVNRLSVAFDSSTYEVQNVDVSGDVLDIGRDPDSQRYHFTVNAVVTLRQLS